jgi:hypothetical protein
VTATALMGASGGWTSNVGIASATTGREVTVRVTADVIRVFPLGHFTVAASGSAPIEEFIPQPERP